MALRWVVVIRGNKTPSVVEEKSANAEATGEAVPKPNLPPLVILTLSILLVIILSETLLVVPNAFDNVELLFPARLQ